MGDMEDPHSLLRIFYDESNRPRPGPTPGPSARWAGRGRVLVRLSGTENKARVLVEGPDARRIRALADDISERIRRALG